MAEGRSEFSTRGLFLPNGKRIFSTPTTEQIAVVNAHPKAEYFSTLGPNPEVTSKWMIPFGVHHIPGFLEHFNKKGNTYYEKHVLGPLLEKVSSEFGISPPNLALRGSAGSLDRQIDTKTYGKILTLEQMLKAGSDTGKQTTQVASFDKEIDPKSITEDAVTSYGRGHADAYLKSWSGMLRNDLIDQEDAKSIFPILFIYDTTKIKKDHFDHVLPNDPKLREQAIVKAYVLDHLHEENAKKIKVT